MTMTPSALCDLSGKTALVTGGATGIGRMATTGLMAAGARVLIASRKGEACVAVSTALNSLGLSGTAEGFGGDVGSETGIAALCQDSCAAHRQAGYFDQQCRAHLGRTAGAFSL